ncbi:FMRFamide receptor [Teleopsis dalmanni]|uniref:FMRFamide receptor n=1 Tax=Teleopsis dalmanni TaxID=139649 RepID=UPI0018CE0A58|nr:FMRFamide receptor [Teleopsis dalmanni]
MIEFNATSENYPSLLHKLQSIEQLPQQIPPNAKDSFSNFDSAPIDLQEFIASATGHDIPQVFLDYATSAAASTLIPALQTATSETTWQSLFTTEKLFNDSYINDTDISFQYPYSENWTTTCDEVYDPHLLNNCIEFWVCGIVLNIVGILGIIGNIISMIILSRPQMRSSINYLLIGLARCDTVLIITSILLFGIPSIYPYTGNFFFYYNYIYPFISPAIYPIAMMAQTASIYMTFTVTLERYVAVCHPLKARALCTYGRAKIYFIVCVIFSLLYNFSRFWEVLTITYQPSHSPVVLHCVRPSALRRNLTYINIYIHWCYFIVNYIVPFSTLAILNCLIYRQVKRANRERQRLSRSEKREIGLATMLLCVVIVFFLFNFPALVINISEAFYNIIDHSLTKTSNLLVTINSSANFLIYVIFGEKFKRIFLLIFFKRRLSRDQPDLIHYESSISNNGDGTINHRSSGRFSRHGTQRSTTTYLGATSVNNTIKNVRLTQTGSPAVVKIKRSRAPSPGPIVYYPAREIQRASTTPVLSANNNTTLGCDLVETKNGQMTSGF